MARIALEDWMTAPETRAVIAALQAGEGGEVRFVGGCLRDALAGRPVQDIDLATPLLPDEVLRRLEAAGLKAVPTGIEHGTVTAVSGGRPYEITTLREDVEPLGRHARVAFTDDWEADAARRDFTMNALSCDPEGGLYDYFGGRADLKAGRVRFVGEAARRIEEDYLRLLRFFRFHAHFGRGAPDPEGLEAARSHAGGLDRLSGERVRRELFRLLEAPDPAPLLALMADRQILAHILPEHDDPAVLAALTRIGNGPPDPVLRLAALHAPAEGLGERLGARLRCSRAETDRLSALLDPAAQAPDLDDSVALRRQLYRQGAERLRDRLALAEARAAVTGAPLPAETVARAEREIRTWRPVAFPLQGKDALALGLPAGPAVGKALKAVEEWWIREGFAPNREACLARLKEEVAGRP